MLDVILTCIPDSDNLEEIEMYKQMIWKSVRYLTSERCWDCWCSAWTPCSVSAWLPHVYLCVVLFQKVSCVAQADLKCAVIFLPLPPTIVL